MCYQAMWYFQIYVNLNTLNLQLVSLLHLFELMIIIASDIRNIHNTKRVQC